LTATAHRILPPRFEGQEFLYPYFMLPLVAEVVLVHKPLVETEPQRAKGHRTSIMGIDKTLDPRNGKVFFAETKAVEMKVRPREGNLDDVVQIRQRIVSAD
jgi:hypothetical protein